MTEQTEAIKIVFIIPDKSAPGFYYRQKRALELKKAKLEDPSVETLDQLVDFLADYVQAETHEQAVELMQMASEQQWDELLDALGGKASTVIPPQSSETSAKP